MKPEAFGSFAFGMMEGMSSDAEDDLFSSEAEGEHDVERERLSPQTPAWQRWHPEYRQSGTGSVVIVAMLPRGLCLKAL